VGAEGAYHPPRRKMDTFNGAIFIELHVACHMVVVVVVVVDRQGRDYQKHDYNLEDAFHHTRIINGDCGISKSLDF
jgi:hypothetical protein